MISIVSRVRPSGLATKSKPDALDLEDFSEISP
jgi:hypothetical protein